MSKPTEAATFESRAYENARQRDAVIAVMHRMKRQRDEDVRQPGGRRRLEPTLGHYCSGRAAGVSMAIEELRKALCLPVDWDGETT